MCNAHIFVDHSDFPLAENVPFCLVPNQQKKLMEATVAKAMEATVIHEGDTVICQTSDGRMFFQAAKKDECVGCDC